MLFLKFLPLIPLVCIVVTLSSSTNKKGSLTRTRQTISSILSITVWTDSSVLILCCFLFPFLFFNSTIFTYNPATVAKLQRISRSITELSKKICVRSNGVWQHEAALARQIKSSCKLGLSDQFRPSKPMVQVPSTLVFKHTLLCLAPRIASAGLDRQPL